MFPIGVLSAFGALIGWSFGDFLIQRVTRKIGSVETLFYIGFFGAIILLPFAWSGIPGLFHNQTAVNMLLLTTMITVLAAIIDFEALKRGKMGVVEPIMSLELVGVVIIGLFFLREHVTYEQIKLIALIMAGIVLIVIHREPRHWWQWLMKRQILEQGTALAVVSAMTMAVATVFIGLSSRYVNPISAIWFIHSAIGLMCFLWLVINRRLSVAVSNLIKNWPVVLSVSFCDNIAWVFYAVAVRTLPISIATAITESYIAFASILGILFNKERFQFHQKFGIVVTIVAAIVLGIISGG